MAAMHIDTGEEILGAEEVEQAIDTVLSTVPGDRFMRADYGSELFELTDVGMNASGKMRVAQAVGESLRRFEPRVRVDKLTFEGDAGELTPTVHGVITLTSQQIVVKPGR